MNPYFCKGFEKTAIAFPALGGAGRFLTAGFIGLEAMNAAQRTTARSNAMRGVKMTGTGAAMNNLPRHVDINRGIRQTGVR